MTCGCDTDADCNTDDTDTDANTMSLFTLGSNSRTGLVVIELLRDPAGMELELKLELDQGDWSITRYSDDCQCLKYFHQQIYDFTLCSIVLLRGVSTLHVLVLRTSK